MYTNPIENLCDGDFPGRNIARKYITLEDLILLSDHKEDQESGDNA